MDDSQHQRPISAAKLIYRSFGLLPRIPTMLSSGLETLFLDNNAYKSLGRVLADNAKRYPNKMAVYFEDRTYTHAEFHEITNQYANAFLSFGVDTEDVVAVYLENRIETLFIVAGLAKIGAIASLINSNQKGKVLAHSMNLYECHHFAIGSELFHEFEAIKSELNLNRCCQIYEVIDANISLQSTAIDLVNTVQTQPKGEPETMNYVKAHQAFAYIFTSGTTGLPKASIQTHERWLNAKTWFGKVNINLGKNDVLYISIPFFHANALIVGWSSAAAGGAAMAIRRKFSASQFWKDVKKYNATAFVYIGEICRYLMNQPASKRDAANSIKKVIGNGLRPDIWDSFKKRFGIKKVYEFYAASDGNVGFTNTLNIESTVGWCVSKFSIVEYDIANDEPIEDSNGYFIPVKKGDVGLMITKITALSPFNGYVNKKANEKKIFKNVFEQGDSYFNTGDLMRDLGYKHAQFVDRLGDTFRWKGENVSTAEVEEMINALPFVNSSAVYGVQIPDHDGRAGMAALVINEGHSFNRERILHLLQQKLPAYAIPVFIRICDQFEVTATQKIKKFPLKQEGFEIENCQANLYVLLPKANTYIPVDNSLLNKIKNGQVKF